MHTCHSLNKHLVGLKHLLMFCGSQLFKSFWPYQIFYQCTNRMHVPLQSSVGDIFTGCIFYHFQLSVGNTDCLFSSAVEPVSGREVDPGGFWRDEHHIPSHIQVWRWHRHIRYKVGSFASLRCLVCAFAACVCPFCLFPNRMSPLNNFYGYLAVQQQ